MRAVGVFGARTQIEAAGAAHCRVDPRARFIFHRIKAESCETNNGLMSIVSRKSHLAQH
jgi:hypothetical protein